MLFQRYTGLKPRVLINVKHPTQTLSLCVILFMRKSRLLEQRGVRFCELCVCLVPWAALYHHITRITTRLIIIYGVYGQLGIIQIGSI